MNDFIQELARIFSKCPIALEIVAVLRNSKSENPYIEKLISEIQKQCEFQNSAPQVMEKVNELRKKTTRYGQERAKLHNELNGPKTDLRH